MNFGCVVLCVECMTCSINQNCVNSLTGNDSSICMVTYSAPGSVSHGIWYSSTVYVVAANKSNKVCIAWLSTICRGSSC